MCTIAILIGVVDGLPLVLAANRDELYARPTRAPEVLRAEAPVIAGGVDVLSGGTWLALRADARFAAVTNQRALAHPLGLRSRGLVVRELAEADDPDAYVAAIDPTAYASMNLVWGDARGAQVAYVRREDPSLEVAVLPPGIHVLCNDRLGADGFPRGERLHAAIAAAATPGRAWVAVRAALERALADHTRVALADTPPSHLPAEVARELTATCIHSEAYGTRSSTIIALAGDRVVDYLHADGPPCTTAFADRRSLLR